METTVSFFAWVKKGNLFIHSWSISNPYGLAVGIVMTVCLAAFYQQRLYWLTLLNTGRQTRSPPNSTTDSWKATCHRVFMAMVQAADLTVAYLLMLLAMTYDLRIFIAIVVGSGTSYYLFTPYMQTSLKALADSQSDQRHEQRCRVVTREGISFLDSTQQG